MEVPVSHQCPAPGFRGILMGPPELSRDWRTGARGEAGWVPVPEQQ